MVVQESLPLFQGLSCFVTKLWASSKETLKLKWKCTLLHGFVLWEECCVMAQKTVAKETKRKGKVNWNLDFTNPESDFPATVPSWLVASKMCIY